MADIWKATLLLAQQFIHSIFNNIIFTLNLDFSGTKLSF